MSYGEEEIPSTAQVFAFRPICGRRGCVFFPTANHFAYRAGQFFYITPMEVFFDFIARGVGSLTLRGGGNYSIEEAREYARFGKERLGMGKYFTEEEQEMLKCPMGSIAFGFEQVGKAMRGAVADVRQKHGF
ncbi:hypothetical protein R83H12_01646 [Fibrobacteria bacterium R8-3-H12]